MQHSGSLDYYTSRPLLRWDWLEPTEIDHVLQRLASSGRSVYLAVDDWEVPQLKARFKESPAPIASLGTPLFQSRPRVAINAFVFHLSPPAPAE